MFATAHKRAGNAQAFGGPNNRGQITVFSGARRKTVVCPQLSQLSLVVCPQLSLQARIIDALEARMKRLLAHPAPG